MLENISVEEFTSPSPLSVEPRAGVQEARKIMQDNGVRHIVVLDKGDIVGILSSRDLKFMDIIDEKWSNLLVEDVMVREPFIVDPSTKLEDVAFEMSSKKIGSAVVYSEASNFLGIFTTTDALNALIEIARGDLDK
tara:strand:+ start:4919 stop:5326 length:408 start_codon:yes stop_codon:yes gene_type:complete